MNVISNPALMNTERVESANLTAATTGASINLAGKGSHPGSCDEPAIKPNRFGDVMMENSDVARLTRVLAVAAALAGLAASIASCSGNGSNPPPNTQHPTTTTTTTAPPPRPSEKGINPTETISPTGGNLFTPTVHASPAPTAIPGNRENTG